MLDWLRRKADAICRLEEAETRLAGLMGTDYTGIVKNLVDAKKNAWGTEEAIEKIEWITRMIATYGDCVKECVLLTVVLGLEHEMEMLLMLEPDEVQKLRDMQMSEESKGETVHDSGFERWKQTQGVEASDAVDEQLLHDIFDAMDNEDKQ